MNTALLPREHGAWSMLLLPFAAAAWLLQPPWPRLAAGFVLVMALFLSREPLIVLARQRWVWRTPHEETPAAKRWLLVLVPVIVGSGLAGIPRSAWPMAALCGSAAATLMSISVWLAVRNRQHSILFQTIGSAGLAASALVVALGSPPIRVEAWIIWAASALHGISAIPVVHARLAMRRRQVPNLAAASSGAFATLAITAVLLPAPLSFALGFSGLVHLGEWLALRSPGAGQAPLTKLGLRLMTESILFTTLLVWTLRR